MGASGRKYAAELIGTFVLVLGGVGSAVLAGDKIGNLGVSFAFGLSLLAMVYAIGPISGCHVNPAVTLGVLLVRKITPRDAAGYVVAQVIGAIAAAGVILLLAKGGPLGYDATTQGLGANGFGAHSPGQFDIGAAFLVEAVLTGLLIFTVLRVTDIAAPVGFAGLAIGLVLVLIHLASIPITNTSVNPARSLGPAVFVGDWALSQLWLFIVAPLLGAAVSAFIYIGLREGQQPVSLEVAEEALPGQREERLTETPGTP